MKYNIHLDVDKYFFNYTIPFFFFFLHKYVTLLKIDKIYNSLLKNKLSFRWISFKCSIPLHKYTTISSKTSKILMITGSSNNQIKDTRISVNWRVINSRISTKKSHRWILSPNYAHWCEVRSIVDCNQSILWHSLTFLVNFQFLWVFSVFQVAWQPWSHFITHNMQSPRWGDLYSAISGSA